jgi:hypothetical protein
MKRAILILCAGLASGLVAHEAWLAARRPASQSLDAQLVWMRAYLQLDASQFERLKALHEEHRPRLRELGAEVAHARIESAAFEERRRTSGQVDFIAFAQFVQERREVDRQCTQSTHELVAAALAVMTPEQRARYLQMVTPALEEPVAGSIY